MTKDEKDFQENVLRVALNLGTLLDIGLFPGKHTVGLEEAKGLVKKIVEETNKKLSSLEPAPAPAPAPEPAPAA